MTLGGREVDIGEEGLSCKNNTMDYLLERSTEILVPPSRPSPPHIHSHDEWDQAFPVFITFLLPCINKTYDNLPPTVLHVRISHRFVFLLGVRELCSEGLLLGVALLQFGHQWLSLCNPALPAEDWLYSSYRDTHHQTKDPMSPLTQYYIPTWQTTKVHNTNYFIQKYPGGWLCNIL